MLSLTSPFRTLLIYLGVHPWHSSLSPSLLAPLSSAHRQGTIGSPFIYFSVLGRLSRSPSLSISLIPPWLALPGALPSLTPWPTCCQGIISRPPSLSLGPSCSPSSSPLYHILFPSRDHRVTVYLFSVHDGSRCPQGIIGSPFIYFGIHDGSRALRPSLALPISLLPLCAPSSILPLALSLSRSLPPSPSSLPLF